jgi:hypothetical protein
MTDDQKQRLQWARDMLLTARERLVEERSQATHGRSVNFIQIITMVDAVALICKEMVEATGGVTQ